MDYYNCKVRIGGNAQHEVHKTLLSAPEVLILRRIHDDESVLNVKYMGTCSDIDDFEERERLILKYGEGLAHVDEEPRAALAKLFGGEFTPLVNRLPSLRKVDEVEIANPYQPRVEEIEETPEEEVSDELKGNDLKTQKAVRSASVRRKAARAEAVI